MMEQKEVILSARDVEIQFSLRGKNLNASGNVLWTCTRVKRWRSSANQDPESLYLRNPLSECWTPTVL